MQSHCYVNWYNGESRGKNISNGDGDVRLRWDWVTVIEYSIIPYIRIACYGITIAGLKVTSSRGPPILYYPYISIISLLYYYYHSVKFVQYALM